ncbi:hypothetical protein PQU94_06735 [Asticcacaulis sp. DXS10W]|uniref:Uncharacterized protein n=1 Tax=Asticcacaulis currens TaxID=2984210 RepID=A0ABT5ICR2_9CAUL|nr:hypothetical protein [Asticcacaulis currens]MDC7693977.1 hypothetical protein [Asticcacaulis currens]
MRKFLAATFCLSVFALFVAGLLFWPSVHRPDHPLFYVVERTAPPAAVREAIAYQKRVKAQDWESLSQRSLPAMMTAEYRKTIPIFAKYIPAKPDLIRVAQWQTTYTTGQPEITTITLLNKQGDSVLISTVQFVKQVSSYKANNFKINYLNSNDLKSVDFSFARLNSERILFLFISSGVLLFSLYTLYVCLSVKGIPLGWLWAISVAIGFTRLSYFWINNMISWQPLFLGFPVSGYAQGLASSFEFYVTLPLGAILFWASGVKHKRKSAKLPQPPFAPKRSEDESGVVVQP